MLVSHHVSGIWKVSSISRYQVPSCRQHFVVLSKPIINSVENRNLNLWPHWPLQKPLCSSYVISRHGSYNIRGGCTVPLGRPLFPTRVTNQVLSRRWALFLDCKWVVIVGTATINGVESMDSDREGWMKERGWKKEGRHASNPSEFVKSVEPINSIMWSSKPWP